MHIEKKDTQTKYNLPPQVKFCTKCVISNQRPRIIFDQDGVCSACQFAEFKKTQINWEQREAELQALCNKHRKDDGSYDILVPCSGGKDGGFVAHILKSKYGMNPLTVTWAPHIATEIGRQNLTNFIDSGFDNIVGTPNGHIHRLLTKLSFIHLGDNFQPFIYGQTNFPLRMAVQHNISLIMYGENGEVEYGGNMKNAFRPTREVADHDNHYFSGLPPEFWIKHGVKPQDLHPYLAPPYEKIKKNNTEIHFLSYYHHWDPQENYYYCREHTGFRPNSARSEGTYSKYASLDDKLDGFHYYLGFIKFGIGRATSDAAHEIRDAKINREEGIALIRKYDGEFPQKHFREFLEYCNIDEGTFWTVIDSWRSEHLWKKEGEKWILKNTIYDRNNLSEGAYII